MAMDDDTMAEWVALGDRLAVAGPEKLQEVIEKLREVADAQEIIAKFDGQLIFRGRRPTKRYLA